MSLKNLNSSEVKLADSDKKKSVDKPRPAHVINTGTGYFLLDTTREAVLRHDDETVQQKYETGISILTSALFEAKVKDSEIIRLLQKHYELRESEAQEQFRIENN